MARRRAAAFSSPIRRRGSRCAATFPGATIFVLHGLQEGSGETVADATLCPVLNNPGELARYAALARRREQRLPAALQIDTGMCRLGFSAAELRAPGDRATCKRSICAWS